MEQITLNEGQAVYQVGERSEHVFLILSGSVGLFSPIDMTTPFARFEQSEVFGETGLIRKQLRCSKAVCLEDCEVLKVSKSDFLKRMDSCDPLLKRLLDTKISQSVKTERSTNLAGISEAA